MKIGILTQPLHDNYGGLLQAYALTTALNEMNHTPIIIDRRRVFSKFRKKFVVIKNSVLGRKISPHLLISEKLLSKISKENILFREKYIPYVTDTIVDNKGMYKLNEEKFEAFIVGSDQCWRPKYSPNIYNYFLDFISNNNEVKKLSYAASFGVSEWEFNEKQTIKCKQLVKKFDAISVRENSAIDIVDGKLDRNDAIHVVDPTMLLPVKHYLEILTNEKVLSSAGSLKVYVLDKTQEKINFINVVEKVLNLEQFEVLPKKRIGEVKVSEDNVFDFSYPGPLKWIKGFQDAKFVITDSFHGTVFAILFNKPFIALGNKKRGMARFESLLSMFELENRIVTNLSNFEVKDICNEVIDWTKVNAILETERGKGIKFLKDNL